MKIDAFDYIKKAAKELTERRKALESASLELNEYLERIFETKDETVSFTHRIKTADSLKEKILRNELYKTIDIADLFNNLSDVIGVRIGCRFLKDEVKIYERLTHHFFLENGEGYLYHPHNKSICLNLNIPQPERQHNGFDIYRIDGYIIFEGEKYRFELQIKSLINNFWSDIEHKIIYKNKRYLGSDTFIRELMNSIYANLVNIDMQLNMLFARSVDRSNTEFFAQTESVITIMMDELSSELIEYKTGIAVNMSGYSERLVKYILSHSSFKMTGSMNDVYSGVVLNLITRLQGIEFKQIPVGERIDLDLYRPAQGLEGFMGEKIRSEINSDFYVNTFFHILFALETGDDEQDFSRFICYCCDTLREENKDSRDTAIIEKIKPLTAAQLLKGN